MYETFLLHEIRSQICLRAGIVAITPADCKYLSQEIRKITHKNVSETTLKRFFGFAAVSHGFSKYTLTALSEYADFPEISLNKEQFNIDVPISSWFAVHHKIGKITDYVLKEIRNRSGLPYEMTISRKFAQHDFEEFYHNHANFMCFIAHPGHGKTILLSHIVQKYFREENAQYKDSIALFINASSFYRPDQIVFNLEDHLKNVLGIPPSTDLINYLNSINDQQKKFLLIIDGFAEVIMKKELKSQLFDEILNFICALDHNPNIKIIMGMRPTLWVRFYERMRNSAYLKGTWFKGNYFNINDASNVPPLTEEELQQITLNTGHTDYSSINASLKTHLKYPFHIQLYYQLQEEDPLISYSTNITYYELIARFIQEKIFKSNYYTEKILFIRKLVQVTQYGLQSNHIEKSLLIPEMMAFKNAYMELIVDGILIEEKRSHNFYPKEFIGFLHSQVFEYFIHIELLENFRNSAPGEMLQYIDKTYKGHAMRFILLQWSVRHLIKISAYERLTTIFNLELNNYERNYLLLFIAENLKYDIKLHPEKQELITYNNFHENIIIGLNNLDFIDSCYSEGINVLLEICRKNQSWVAYHTILSVIDILSLDAEKIQRRINILSLQTSLCEASPVNPLDFLRIAIAKVKDEPIDISSLMNKIDGHISGENSFANPNHPDTLTGIFYMLLLGLNLFFGDNNKDTQIINIVYKLHPKLIYKRTPFAIYTLLLYGVACAHEDKLERVIQIRNIVTHVASNKDKYGFTLFSESLLTYLNALIAQFKGDYNSCLIHSEIVLDIYKRNPLNASSLIIYNLIIDTYYKLNDFVKMNEFKYEKRCFMEERNIPKGIFPYHQRG